GRRLDRRQPDRFTHFRNRRHRAAGAVAGRRPAIPHTRHRRGKPIMIRLQGQVGIRAVLLVSMAIWGLNVTIVKQLTTGLDATTIAMLRMLVASTTLATIWVLRRPALGRLDRRQWLALAACAFLMVY